ncbi:MAG: UDP-N-acetylmuramate dehydrogenase [Anaerolineae bacterium]|nr:UDP-N-acetylmuramate dehydrogenase [Anaerolineae bacterium]
MRVGEPLARYTSLRVGGPAELLAIANDVAALRRAVALGWQHGVPCRVLGGGSNVLVSDTGIPGLTILNRARAVLFEADRVWADSGTSFSTLARRAVDRGLAGLEWAAGIPGSVGGAVAGNAGAWGGDVASILVQARMLVPGERAARGDAEAYWAPEQFDFGYRTSVLRRASHRAGGAPQPVVLAAAFRLEPGNPTELAERVSEINATRRARQPQGATCGSVFKNPPGDYAGRLVEAVGLKGTARGAAVISPVHANFVVNRGGATAADVKALIDLACETVHAHLGLRLELEIELLGNW